MTYTNEENIYTIIWKNGDVVLEIDNDVAEGIVPIYDGEFPIKEPDAQYQYAFAGWTPEVGVAHVDATYTAVFTSVPNTYLYHSMEKGVTTQGGNVAGDLANGIVNRFVNLYVQLPFTPCPIIMISVNLFFIRHALKNACF